MTLTTSVPTVVAELAGIGRLPVEANVVPEAGMGMLEEVMEGRSVELLEVKDEMKEEAL